ncbi:unnamed protein product, partial [Nesidiocoris tenuis]
IGASRSRRIESGGTQAPSGGAARRHEPPTVAAAGRPCFRQGRINSRFQHIIKCKFYIKCKLKDDSYAIGTVSISGEEEKVFQFCYSRPYMVAG